MRNTYKVIWCKWSFWAGFYRLHSKTLRSIEKARKYAEKVKKNRRKFIWSYEVNGIEKEAL